MPTLLDHAAERICNPKPSQPLGPGKSAVTVVRPMRFGFDGHALVLLE
jgi:hypothetical protein